MRLLFRHIITRPILLIIGLLASFLLVRMLWSGFLVYLNGVSTEDVSRTVPLKIHESGLLQRNNTYAVRTSSEKGTRIDVLTDYPDTFIEDIKNPCWLTDQHDLFCLPYFYLAGMPKCGTTDIWMRLMEHPQIWSVSKEPHWWAKVRVDHFRGRTSLNSSASSYYHRWGKMFEKITKKKGPEEMSTLILGDGSASTFWDHRYWPSFFPNLTYGPPYSTAALIRSIQPDAKIIVAFRNPIQRLYSGYLYFAKYKNMTSPKHFHENVLSSVRDFEKCLVSLSDVRTCAYQRDKERLRLRVGLYSVYTEEWLSQFPRNQIFFITTEEWSKNCSQKLPQLHKFLDLDAMNSAEVGQICRMKRSNVGHYEKISILQETQEVLSRFYTPYNKQLAKLLDDDMFLWTDQ